MEMFHLDIVDCLELGGFELKALLEDLTFIEG